jgi:hypothetical protein
MQPNNNQAKQSPAGPGKNPCADHHAGRKKVLSAAVVLLGLWCGCKSERENGAMTNSYYLSPSKDLRRLGRVALAELGNSTSVYPQFPPEMTDALFLAVQKEQLFGLTMIRRDDKDWQALQENLNSVETLRQLAKTRETLRCNALLMGTVTQYKPYPHLVIGLRLQLLDLTDGQLVWGLEQVWDSADQNIQKRISAYAKGQVRSGAEPIREELVAVSTLSFAKFVAYEAARTLEREKKR